MRLIDADKLILHLNYYALQVAPFRDLESTYKYNTVQECIKAVDEQPTAYDVDKVVEQCENVAERYADCDEFVCSKCGIHLMEWVKVSIDEDYDDEIHSEYVFKYCPNCGAKIKAGGIDA